LMMCISGTWLAIYLGGDMLVFMLLKVTRGDFRYWLNLPPSISLPVSLIVRFLTKVLTDFTLVMQMRHSYEIGGVQFSLLILINQASCFVAGWVYLKEYDSGYDGKGEELGGDNPKKINAETLWAGLQGLSCLFWVSCVAFIGLIDRKYLHTFFSRTTGPQYAIKQYNIYTTDLQRVAVFDQHPKYYEGVKDAMQELIDDNWEDWMKDRPEWLTDNVIASIPDEYLEKTEVNRLEKEGGGKRRRSSAFVINMGIGEKGTLRAVRKVKVQQ